VSEAITEYKSGDRSSFERTVEGVVRRLLGYGLKAKVRFTTSLRVGSGAATLASLDGADGLVMADGASAALVGRDRSNSAHYFLWYEDTTIRLATQGADLWLIDAGTGLFVQTWLTVGGTGAAFTNAWANFGSGNAAAAYRLNALGQVEIKGFITGGTAGTSAWTLPAGLRPGEIRTFQGAYYNGASYTQTPSPVAITTAGLVIPEITPAVGGAIAVEIVMPL
jgi:hypothetical protein